MSASDPIESKTPAWIQKLKSQGPIPLQEPDDCSGGAWSSPPGRNFLVRGPDYFNTKSKVPAGPWLLKPLAFDWLKASSKIHRVLDHPNNRVKAALESEDANGSFVWAFNLQVPSRDNYSAIAYFVSSHPFPEDSLVTRFLRGDEAFRNSRLKLIANVVSGPWIVRTAVGEQAICVLGRAVSCKYHQGVNFIEVDVDIGASILANAVVHLAFGYVTSLTVELAFLIESQSDDELPEEILGAIRFANLDPSSAVSMDHAEEEEEEEEEEYGDGEDEDEEDDSSESGYKSSEETELDAAPLTTR